MVASQTTDVDLYSCLKTYFVTANKAYFSEIAVKTIAQSFTHKMAAKANWL